LSTLGIDLSSSAVDCLVTKGTGRASRSNGEPSIPEKRSDAGIMSLGLGREDFFRASDSPRYFGDARFSGGLGRVMLLTSADSLTGAGSIVARTGSDSATKEIGFLLISAFSIVATESLSAAKEERAGPVAG
jgi:hypothetical protein